MTVGLPRKRPIAAMVWGNVSTALLPFADVAGAELPLARLLRLSLFQVSVGMALALTVGTLNRVLIVELGAAATLVSVMVALPILFAPFRALIGFKSDIHRSALGWRRVPYIWYGSMIQFGGLAIMPFALLVLSGDNNAPVIVGQFAAALAFLLIGIGLQTTQTAGLALATDLAPEEARPRVVALMYVMLLVGMFISSFIFGFLLMDFTPLRLIQVIQGAAVITMVLNIVALWKQEARDPMRNRQPEDRPPFGEAWRNLIAVPGARRFLTAVALGTAAFSMQDILLEPYGGEVLHMGVGQTSLLTALFGGSALAAFAAAARLLARGREPFRLAAHGVLIGLPGFAAIVLAGPFESPMLFCIGAGVIGFGSGLFSVATLTAAMGLDSQGRAGLALGAWGAVQATATGAAIGLGGFVRDGVSALAVDGRLGLALTSPTTGYGSVYYIEILLLFATLVAIGPLARHAARDKEPSSSRFGIADFPT